MFPQECLLVCPRLKAIKDASSTYTMYNTEIEYYIIIVWMRLLMSVVRVC